MIPKGASDLGKVMTWPTTRRCGVLVSTASATFSASLLICGASAAISYWSSCSWGAAVASASSADSTTSVLLRCLVMVAGVRADFLFAVFLPLRVDVSCGEDGIAFVGADGNL